jgi:hypothetical protein
MNLTPSSRLSLSIAGAITIAGALIGTGWRAANAVNELRSEVVELRRDLRSFAADRWTFGDMERWAYRLERDNRERPIAVPDVRIIRSERVQPQ